MISERGRPISSFFQHRSERERIVFERVRQIANLPTILRRRAAARQLSADAPFGIDADRGFAVFPPGTFVETADIVSAARTLGMEVDTTRREVSKKARSGFMVPMMDGGALTLASPFLRFALRPDVIAAVSSYLGIVPVITRLNVFYSESSSEKARSSQLFHCDADGTRQIKIFILCTEVTPAQGPLTLIDARTSRAQRRRLGYHFGGKVKDKILAREVSPDEHHAIVGPPGTTCFVDTTQCFHFGSRVEQGASPRLVTIIQYISPSSFIVPYDHRAGSPFRHLPTDEMSSLQRLVLGLA